MIQVDVLWPSMQLCSSDACRYDPVMLEDVPTDASGCALMMQEDAMW